MSTEALAEILFEEEAFDDFHFHVEESGYEGSEYESEVEPIPNSDQSVKVIVAYFPIGDEVVADVGETFKVKSPVLATNDDSDEEEFEYEFHCLVEIVTQTSSGYDVEVEISPYPFK